MEWRDRVEEGGGRRKERRGKKKRKRDFVFEVLLVRGEGRRLEILVGVGKKGGKFYKFEYLLIKNEIKPFINELVEIMMRTFIFQFFFFFFDLFYFILFYFFFLILFFFNIVSTTTSRTRKKKQTKRKKRKKKKKESIPIQPKPITQIFDLGFHL